ncbi:hypothetical protein KXD93_17530 [Mucilaginibacter sp. BJC16-A38]|uniref:hypothetical protein n=1 Tax=Mucilaginibacter phenanthrenivorans TaxID=1234842 RepID=UPI00215760EB|nr:hypothetical protein [Mucilaginibacter phenanthrenivorans]MCR8559463.1 hypothetical protein [Mucilaginibacter phenanthrenivorans]
MNRIKLILLLFFCYLTSSAQTRVMILGSVHTPTKYITKDTLLKALKDFKADVILLELDTSLMDNNGIFKRDPGKMSLESGTAQSYRQANAGTVLRPIDVVYRNKYYTEHKTFAKENQMGKVIDSLFKNNMMNDTTWFITSSLCSATQILNNYGYMQLNDINSKAYMDVASSRQNLLYQRQVAFIKNNDDLKTWYPFAKEDADFWDLRNDTMAHNIITYARKYPGKNIAVIVGCYHKYALVDRLKDVAKTNGFTLVKNY